MWLGGRNYFRSLLLAFAQPPDPEIEPVIFTSAQDGAALVALPPTRVVRTAMMDHGTSAWILRQIVTKTLLVRLVATSPSETTPDRGDLAWATFGSQSEENRWRRFDSEFTRHDWRRRGI